MSDKKNTFDDEFAELLTELNSQGILKEEEKEETPEYVSSIPLSEDEIETFSFDDEEGTDVVISPTPLEDFSLTDGEALSEEDILATAFSDEGLSEDLRKQMLMENMLHEDAERVVDRSDFTDLISDVLQEQSEYIEEHGTFTEVEPLTDLLEEYFEMERGTKLLHVENTVLSIQQEDEEITEYILCEGIYTEAFKIFIHDSPLIVDGDMALVIELDGDYVLFRRINPEPKVIKHMLNSLPNFKFIHVTPEGESEVTPFSFLDKCKFTV